ncbi:MAG: response regulator transcription factor [Spirosomaceae bacterium]|nr:response regulator transcription factor [Spirosomataceae bacterium]
MNETVIKVALYEDNATLRTSLTHLLQSSEEFEFLGAYDSPINILENSRIATPDVILMDVDMPLMNGIDATRLLKENYPQVNILILTVFEDRDKLFSALQAGASGYLLKKSKIIEIIEAIHEIYNGGSPMTPAIARKVLEFFAQPKTIQNKENDLSERELDILKCLVNGDSYKMIAANCYISMGTVRSHINNIYKKLHVNSKSEAVVKALKEKIV